MANGGFLINNIATQATPTCAYDETLFPAANLIDNIPSVAYRSTGINSLPRWNFGSNQTVTAFSMHNHNVPNDATIKLQFSSNDWVSVAEEVTIDWASQQLFKTFTSKNYQYMGLSVVLATGTYVEIGEIFWGTSWQFVNNYNAGFNKIKKVYKEMRNSNGHTFVSIKSVQRGYAMDFANVTEAELLTFEALLEQEKVVFIPDYAINVPLFGTIENDVIDAKVSRSGKNSFSLQFFADTLGGA